MGFVSAYILWISGRRGGSCLPALGPNDGRRAPSATEQALCQQHQHAHRGLFARVCIPYPSADNGHAVFEQFVSSLSKQGKRQF